MFCFSNVWALNILAVGAGETNAVCFKGTRQRLDETPMGCFHETLKIRSIAMKKDNGFSTIDTMDLVSLHNKFKRDRLFLRPIMKDGKRTFQRLPHKKRDWKIYLIYSILTGATLPPIWVYEDPEDEAVLFVVDGQQRLSCIFEFMQGDFSLTSAGMMKQGLESLPENYNGCKWDDLSEEDQDKIKKYALRVEVIDEPESADFDQKVRLQFHRLNVTSGGMTSMEIWNSAYNGDFVDLLYDIKEGLGFISPGKKDLKVTKEALAGYFLLNHRIVSKTDVLRLQDMDLILSLMIAMVKKGPQHKDEGLEELCVKYQKMDPKVKQGLYNDFMENMNIIEKIAEAMPSSDFQDTELRKKHDFYSLFCAVDYLRREEGLEADDDLSTIAHNLESFNTYLRSYVEHIQGTRNKTVLDWPKMQAVLSVNMRKDVPVYYTSRTRDWNHNSDVSPSRSTRMNTLIEVMSRKNKLPLV